MKRVICVIMGLLFFCFVDSTSFSTSFTVPRISPSVVKLLILKGQNYVFVDSSTFGDSHICGAIFISYTWVKPHKEKIKRINIPKDFYIFCY